MGTLLKPYMIWIYVAVGIAFAAAITGHFIQVISLRADLKAAEAATVKKQGELDSMRSQRDTCLGSVNTQNAAVDLFKGKCEMAADGAALSASEALRQGEAAKRADEADPTAGADRMNTFFQNVGGGQ